MPPTLSYILSNTFPATVQCGQTIIHKRLNTTAFNGYISTLTIYVSPVMIHGYNPSHPLIYTIAGSNYGYEYIPEVWDVEAGHITREDMAGYTFDITIPWWYLPGNYRFCMSFIFPPAGGHGASLYMYTDDQGAAFTIVDNPDYIDPTIDIDFEYSWTAVPNSSKLDPWYEVVATGISSYEDDIDSWIWFAQGVAQGSTKEYYFYKQHAMSYFDIGTVHEDHPDDWHVWLPKGTYEVTLYVATATKKNSFTKTMYVGVSPPAPIVTSITPNTGINTSDIEGVTIAGSNFDLSTVSLVKTGETSIVATGVIVGATSIICDLPITDCTVGIWDVVVTNPPDNTGSLVGGFTITDLTPFVTTVTPATVQQGGNYTLIINGANFASSSTITTSASIVVNSYTQVTANLISCRISIPDTATIGTSTFTVNNPITGLTGTGSIVIGAIPTGLTTTVGCNFTSDPFNLSFTAPTENFTAVDYDWNFGDGTTSNEQNPKHKYAAVGKYTVTLHVE